MIDSWYTLTLFRQSLQRTHPVICTSTSMVDRLDPFPIFLPSRQHHPLSATRLSRQKLWPKASNLFPAGPKALYPNTRRNLVPPSSTELHTKSLRKHLRKQHCLPLYTLPASTHDIAPRLFNPPVANHGPTQPHHRPRPAPNPQTLRPLEFLRNGAPARRQPLSRKHILAGLSNRQASSAVPCWAWRRQASL